LCQGIADSPVRDLVPGGYFLGEGLQHVVLLGLIVVLPKTCAHRIRTRRHSFIVSWRAVALAPMQQVHAQLCVLLPQITACTPPPTTPQCWKQGQDSNFFMKATKQCCFDSFNTSVGPYLFPIHGLQRNCQALWETYKPLPSHCPHFEGVRKGGGQRPRSVHITPLRSLHSPMLSAR